MNNQARQPVPFMRGHILFSMLVFAIVIVPLLVILPPVGLPALGAFVVYVIREPSRNRARYEARRKRHIEEYGW